MDLLGLRKQIDEIDNELIPLLLKRMSVSEQVAQYKAERGMPVLNSEREQQILDDVASKCGKHGDTIKTVFSATMDASRALQHKIIGGGKELRAEIENAIKIDKLDTCGKPIACQGVEGAYSGVTSKKIFPKASIHFHKRFEDVFDGFMMGTRSGGVDPSVVTFIMKKLNLTPDEMDNILNKQSGVNAISGISSDDRDICAAQNAGNERAILAHEMQAYEIAKYIGSYIAAMNGVDALVFTGGIGENGFWLRSKICSYFGYMGVHINEALNQATVKGAEAELTEPDDKVRVFILATDEELTIARDTQEIVKNLK